MAERLARMKRTLRRIGVAGVVLLAVGVGYLLRSWHTPTQATDMHDGHAHAHGGQDAAVEAPPRSQVWTCSMHPRIKLPKPGQCPICFMDLIPLDSDGDAGGGLRELSVSENAARLMDIETVPVERRFVAARVRMVGKIAYDETRVSTITAWVPGRLDRLFVDYTGVPVKKGDHMVTLYSPELLSAQEELLQAVRTAGELAKSEMSIVRETTQATVEAAREKLRLWGLTPEQIRQIESRGTADDHVTIYAPAGGIVIDKNAQEGMYVNTGTRIYTIADLSAVWATLDAYESDLTWIRYGQKVTFTTEAYPARVFSGTISFIHPVLNEATRTVKVRLNVPNEDGWLKPGMFARAVAEANVATGGRVMDAGLAGKWISPMHPEIVKDGPGACDVCGMPLVRAENLGYVGVEPKEEDRPLVIPASAALLTGRRAVVYVKVPGKDKPTYEGREIVLGPRAGDYYLVKRGLAEGERVVTNGAFKLDAELQIQAKPSMMTPEGGGGSGEHAHHDGTPPMARDEHTAPQKPDLPAVLKAELHQVMAAAKAAVEASAGNSLAAVQDAFNVLRERVNAVSGDRLTGDALVLWEEYRMLLGNDGTVGATITSLRQAQRLAETTREHLRSMQARLGIMHHDRHDPEPSPDMDPEFLSQLDAVIDAYLDIQTALAADNREGAANAAKKGLAALDNVDMSLVTGNAHTAWMAAAADLNTLLDSIAGADDIEKTRAAFALLSEQTAAVLARFGVPGKTLYKAWCPMAFDNRGASWIQRTKEIDNPYFGEMMRRCGEIREVLE